MRKAIQVLGELILTAGLILLLFVVWDLWWTNLEADRRQDSIVKNFSAGIEAPVAPVPGSEKKDWGPPVVGKAPEHAGVIGVVYIPRFGADYSRPFIQGTSQDVLDELGLGHYDDTAMPGAMGNVALAGHRQTHGAVLDNIHTLVPGDKIYIQTKDGYYTYVYRNTEIVLPTQVNVLASVPTQPAATPNARYLTMTSCNPRFGSEERIIAYSVMQSWQPLKAGPPAEIAARVAKNAGK